MRRAQANPVYLRLTSAEEEVLRRATRQLAPESEEETMEVISKFKLSDMEKLLLA